MIPIIILILVFLLIAVRQIGNIRLHIWQIMSGGAIAVLLAGRISVPSAVNSINFDVILFLFGMFVVGEAWKTAGILHIYLIIFLNMQKALTHCCSSLFWEWERFQFFL